MNDNRDQNLKQLHRIPNSFPTPSISQAISSSYMMAKRCGHVKNLTCVHSIKVIQFFRSMFTLQAVRQKVSNHYFISQYYFNVYSLSCNHSIIGCSYIQNTMIKICTHNVGNEQWQLSIFHLKIKQSFATLCSLHHIVYRNVCT